MSKKWLIARTHHLPGDCAAFHHAWALLVSVKQQQTCTSILKVEMTIADWLVMGLNLELSITRWHVSDSRWLSMAGDITTLLHQLRTTATLCKLLHFSAAKREAQLRFHHIPFHKAFLYVSDTVNSGIKPPILFYLHPLPNRGDIQQIQEGFKCWRWAILSATSVCAYYRSALNITKRI